MAGSSVSRLKKQSGRKWLKADMAIARLQSLFTHTQEGRLVMDKWLLEYLEMPVTPKRLYAWMDKVRKALITKGIFLAREKAIPTVEHSGGWRVVETEFAIELCSAKWNRGKRICLTAYSDTQCIPVSKMTDAGKILVASHNKYMGTVLLAINNSLPRPKISA